MKKRILTCFCALLLCLGLLCVPLSVGAAGNPCFLAINDTLQPLEDQFIPIAVGGQYYVPYTALDSSITGLQLGIYPIYNNVGSILGVYSRERAIFFDLDAGTCADRNGDSLNTRAIIRNGHIYVPARFICEYFGLTYSTKTTAYGPLVRIRTASAGFDDNNFTGLAQLMMEERLREWNKSQPGGAIPAVTPTPTPTPVPTPTPEDPDKSDVRAYLSFRADQAGGLAGVLAGLEQYQVKALFFFPADGLAGYDDDVRAVLCAGHGVGLILSGTEAPGLLEQAEQGKDMLAQIAHLYTNTVLAPDVQDPAVYQQLGEEGLLPLRPDVAALPGASLSAQAAAVLRSADQYSQRVHILSDTSPEGAALLGRLLPGLVGDNYDLRLAVETELSE